MKKVLLLIVCLLFVSSLYAFRAGTTSLGGTVAYVSYKYNEDANPINVIIINPALSYFLMDNIAVDGLFEYVNANSDDMDDPETVMKIGVGGRIFFGNLYGGAGVLFTSEKHTGEPGGTYLRIYGGYLLPIVENVYLDIAGMYQMGMGKYSGDDYDEQDNKGAEFVVGAGIEVVFDTGR